MGCSFIGNLYFFNVLHRFRAEVSGGGGRLPSFLNGQYRENLIIVTVNRCNRPPVILVALRSASLTYKNLQRHKIIHGMRPAGRKDRSIDLNMCICRNIRPVRVIFVQFYGCCLTMHICFSPCCALKYSRRIFVDVIVACVAGARK